MRPEEFHLLSVSQQVDAALSLHFSDSEWPKWEQQLKSLGDERGRQRRRFFAERLIQEERAFAEELLSRGRDVSSFPRNSQYATRYRFEISCLEFSLKRRVKSLGIIGSGAFPVSCMAIAEHAFVIGIEIDPQNYEFGRQVASICNSPAKFVCCDAATYDGYGQFDAVVIAGTVCPMASSKQNLLDAIAERAPRGIQILLRDSMREEMLILPHLDLDSLNYDFDVFSLETRDDYMRRIGVKL